MSNINEGPAEVNEYIVKAEVQFTTRSTSIISAYKEFTVWMANAFNASFDAVGEGVEPPCVPYYYEGVAVSKTEGNVGKSYPEEQIACILGDVSEGTLDPEHATLMARRAIRDAKANSAGK